MKDKYHNFMNRINREIVSKYCLPERSLINNYQFYLLDKYIDNEKNILDIGSYDGRVAWMIIDSLKKTPQSICITDWTPEAVEKCIQNMRPGEEKFIDFSVEDVMSLTFKDKKFDTVVAFGNVLNLIYGYADGQNRLVVNSEQKHLHRSEESLLQSIKNMHRVTKVNGKILITIDLKNQTIPNWTDPQDIKNKLESFFDLKVLESKVAGKIHDKVKADAHRRRGLHRFSDYCNHDQSMMILACERVK